MPAPEHPQKDLYPFGHGPMTMCPEAYPQVKRVQESKHRHGVQTRTASINEARATQPVLYHIRIASSSGSARRYTPDHETLEWYREKAEPRSTTLDPVLRRGAVGGSQQWEQIEVMINITSFASGSYLRTETAAKCIVLDSTACRKN